MACEVLTKVDFEIGIRDGANPPVEKVWEMFGDITWASGGWNLESHRKGDGSFADFAPSKVEANVSTLSFDAKLTGSPGVNTAEYDLIMTQIHSASETYGFEIDVIDTAAGETSPTRHRVQWVAGGSAADTDDAAEAAILTELGLTVSASPTGTIAMQFPAGKIVRVVATDIGSSPVSITVSVGFGVIEDELTILDLAHHSGAYERLTGTTGSGICRSEAKTLEWFLRIPGREIIFPRCTHSGSAVASPTGVQVSIAVESRTDYPGIVLR